VAPLIILIMADLDTLLRALNPDVWYEKVERKHLEARASYRLTAIKVDSYAQFKRILADYYAYHGHSSGWIPIPLDQDWSERSAMEALQSHYPGGLNTAYDAARKGLNGGLSRVIDTLRDAFIQTTGDAYLAYAIRKSARAEDFDDLTQLMTQYHQRFKHALDSETAKCPPIAMVSHLEQVIKNHLQSSREMHRITVPT
jgi:hypothetical protein